ncbi:hypothetical protein ENSA7_42910 [Enhygromyxa salina]|uniref:Uncharacterized protein n=2 Tax=Enhygromyxa salina TaxID=215803 RepID=A0A2S9YLQ6_9BACT|nr:hypothetical protein ENSA7_42910 [Enhygromyxa salina]
MRLRTNSPEERSDQTRQRLQSAKSKVHVGVIYLLDSHSSSVLPQRARTDSGATSNSARPNSCRSS